jgi:hypothetical protein
MARPCYRATVSPSHLALTLVIASVAACKASPTPAPATAASPASTTATATGAGAGAPGLIDRERCKSLVSASRAQCFADQQAALDWCMALGRLAEVGPCVPQAARAFECAARTSARCEGAACCSGNRECDDVNIAFSNCARGYCGTHLFNPDCRWFEVTETSSISFALPKRPSTPTASLDPVNPTDPADPADLEGLDAALSAGIRRIDDTHYEVKTSLIEKVLLNPMVAVKGARVVPAMKDGKPEGFKLYAIRPGSLYYRIGLANGDTVQSINGHRLDSVDKTLEVYTQLRDAKRLELGLVRRGKPLTLTITITN